MPIERSTYNGDAEYNICCTGDAVVGDEVRFERATFVGRYRRPCFAGYQLVTGRIVRDSYGAERQQHTFTLEVGGGGTTKIKGRNLYANGVYRRVWPDESKRRAKLTEKHERGDRARAARARRLDAGPSYLNGN